MKCVYELRLMRWSYESAPRQCTNLFLFSFRSEIPCALNKGDEIDGLPGLDAAIVSKCAWSHMDQLLVVKLEDEEFEDDTALKAFARKLMQNDWALLVNAQDPKPQPR